MIFPAARERANLHATRLAGVIARMQTTFQSGLLTLHKMRSGGQQTVRVVHQHVEVNDGGQAVVTGKLKTGGVGKSEGGARSKNGR